MGIVPLLSERRKAGGRSFKGEAPPSGVLPSADPGERTSVRRTAAAELLARTAVVMACLPSWEGQGAGSHARSSLCPGRSVVGGGE